MTKGFSPQVIPVNRPSRMTIVISSRSANSDLPITEFEGVFPLGMVLSDPPNALVSCTPDGTSVPQGQASTLTLAVRNRPVNALTAVNLTDTLPAGLTLAANPNATSTCGGSLSAFPGSNQIVLTGGSVSARPASSIDAARTITVRVTGTTIGTYTNAVLPANFSSSGGTIPAPVSANLAITAGLGATKAFSPAVTAPGGLSRVTIQLRNQSSGVPTNVSVDDMGFAPGLTMANPANAATSCGGTPVLTVNPGAAVARLDGAVLPVGASYDFAFDVVSAPGTGPQINTISAGNITRSEGPFNSSAVTGTLSTQTAQIGINKSFNPVIATGIQPSRLTIDVINGSSVATG